MQNCLLLRKRLYFRAWHRSTRESDLILGSFADSYLASLNQEQMMQFAALLELSDPELYSWITNQVPIPPEHDHDIMKLLKKFTL